MKQVNLLFPSVGRRVELLRHFRNAYAALGINGNIVALDIDPLAPALQVADKVYLVPRYTEPTYIPTIADICRREKINLIFPLIDPDIPRFAAERTCLEATGAKLAVIPHEAALITGDKWATTTFFQSLGLATPRSWLPEELPAEELPYPLFIKPRDGSAAQNTFRVRNRKELDFFVEYVPNPILQEFLPGPEITCDVVADLAGKVLGVVMRQRIAVRSGEVVKGVTVYDPMIAEACVKIAQALPAVGPITVQCMMKAGIPHFTEINARFGGGVPLGVAAGVDAPRWLLAKAAGIPIEIPPIGSYQSGLYMTRFDDSYFLSEQDREALASCRL
ncbi:MAG: ATP-grasp domain-containing protein [Caldilineaceae bacterium]|nr:ATP-grasp domain-containing protein [Caldilineaceae bacterium]